jgi:CTP-dependent riboflavin kinase
VWIAPCTINTVPAFVLRTDANENDVGDPGRNIVEIASEFRLRDMFDLQDGDRVVLELP